MTGAIGKHADDRYIRLIDGFSTKNIKRSRNVRRLAVKDGFTVKDFYAAADGSSLYEVQIYSPDGRLLRTISPETLGEELSVKTLKEPL